MNIGDKVKIKNSNIYGVINKIYKDNIYVLVNSKQIILCEDEIEYGQKTETLNRKYTSGKKSDITYTLNSTRKYRAYD